MIDGTGASGYPRHTGAHHSSRSSTAEVPVAHLRWLWVASAVIAGVTAGPAHAQPVIVLDYTFDTNNFFPVGSQQRTTLETAAITLTSRLSDSLTAITPGGSNS